ncbi:mitochondrial ribosomal death-associated protein 3-domain-containing protein [Poronia punctata]|nr:mitochondrial ribosomal death-associated protein 3-domain-containing protein [Poronia punctata]
MASMNCWRCLARPSQRLLLAPVSISVSASMTASITAPSLSTSAAFSTTSANQVYAKKNAQTPSKKGDPMSRHIRTGKKMALSKKKKKYARVRKPAPGERKAFRKRIQLSNDNALEVRGLEPIASEIVVDPESVGKMVGIPGELVDQLRGCEAFKPSQNWSLFRAPHMLIRSETVELGKRMADAVEKKETLRMVVTGDRGSGKSILGLQALATGFLNQWVVINVPEGQDLTNAHTEYTQIPHSNKFSQPVYTVKLMQAIHKTNQEVLSKHRVQLDHLHLPISVGRNMSLANMLIATKEPDFAWPVFQSFWKELLLPGRPPIVFSLDGLAHIMRMSEYRSPAYELIHSHDLGIVSMFADALGGKTTFANGAVILGVTSRGNAPRIPSMDKALEQAVAAKKGEPIPPRDGLFRKYDERVFDSLRGVDVMDVQGLSRSEARSLLEYWAASGVLRQRVDEKTVTEKWTMSGKGVVGEMERVALYDIRSAA